MKIYLDFRGLRRKLRNRSRSAIYNDIAAGRLPNPFKLGGKNYWDDEGVDAHIAELRETSE